MPWRAVNGRIPVMVRAFACEAPPASGLRAHELIRGSKYRSRPLGPKARAARGPAKPGHFQNGSPYPESAATRLAKAQRGRRGPHCQVCNHPDRARIEFAKISGRGLHEVAKEFGVHKDSLWRHMRKHVTEETKIGYLAGPVKLAELANLAASENKSLIEYLVDPSLDSFWPARSQCAAGQALRDRAHQRPRVGYAEGNWPADG